MGVALEAPQAQVYQALATKDGAIWWTGQLANKLGRLDKNGTIREYTLKSPHTGPHGLAEDKDGNIIEQNKPEKREVLSKETAYIMTDLMRGVVDGGTATRVVDARSPTPRTVTRSVACASGRHSAASARVPREFRSRKWRTMSAPSVARR